ncbi:hypothetical protein [Micromonospora wenchangensis]|uniref:hypothetical protein n=1 Tax=Micromonospora wenchangensis TaxID=1185415 RepID=UPI00380FF360
MNDLDALRTAAHQLRSSAAGSNPSPWAHPAMDRELADWMDSHATDLATAAGDFGCLESPADTQVAVRVARAYLGESR